MRFALGVHDTALLERIERPATRAGMGQEAFEVRMLRGIRTVDQHQLAGSGCQARTLVAFGEAETGS